MADLIIRDQKVYIGQIDMTSYLQGLSLAGQKVAKDNTVLGSSTGLNRAGLETISFSYDGFFDAEGSDDAHYKMFTETTAKWTKPPISVAVTDGTDG